MYADFGRFYAWRVEELLEDMRGDSELAEGLSLAFGESPSQFLDRLTGRLKTIQSEMWGGGTNYRWRSITGWHPDERMRNLA